MSRTLVVILLAICALGLASGSAVRTLLMPVGQIAIYPTHVALQEGHIENEPLEVHFALRNESSRPVSVTSLSTSCGCMALSGANGALKPPFDIEPWGVCPVALNVATGNRIGKQTFGLSATARGPRGVELKTQADVKVNLQAALRAQPSMVIFRAAKPGQELLVEVALADALPNPGVRIREIKLSSEETMTVKIKEESGPSPLFGEDAKAHARATLTLQYTPIATEGRIQEMISIVPDNSRFPTLQIPVYCEIADAPYKFTPSGITIGPTSEPTFTRTALFQSDEPAELSVSRTTPGITIAIGEPTRSARVISIRGDLSTIAQGSHDVVFQVNGHEHVFPIHIRSVN